MDALIGFLSGVGVPLVGAASASLLERIRERRSHVERQRFKVYMKMMELYGLYFWFTTAEFHGKNVDPEVKARCRALAWQVADMLREADEVEYVEEILDVLLGGGFDSARDRYAAMGSLLDKLGGKVNPRYMKRIRKISEENLEVLAAGGCSNAPGATGV